MAVAALAGCASVKDVQPGQGASETFSGRGYDDVWAVAIRVASQHFKIRDSDKTRGTIHAERPAHLTSLGGYIGIFITPSTPGAAGYRVEVVTRKKVATQLSGENWETKVLRDMRDLLIARPGR
jgi:hypothetical protein